MKYVRFTEPLWVELSEFDDVMGARLHVDGKRGEDSVRIISSAPALAIWLDNHLMREDTSAPVWVVMGGVNTMKKINYGAAAALMKKIAKRARIKKRVFYYLMRNTTVDETPGLLTEAQQCMMFGWRFGSKMPAVYKHSSTGRLPKAPKSRAGI